MGRFDRLPRARVLGLEVPIARGRRARLLGLALIDRAAAPAGLLIPRCRGVHTFGMRFALDVAFLDDAGGVVELRRSVGPGRMVSCRRAAAVLEVPADWAGSVGPPAQMAESII